MAQRQEFKFNTSIETCTSNTQVKKNLLNLSFEGSSTYSPKKSSKIITSPINVICRICLQLCSQVQFCKCSGSLSVHQACLAQYLNIRKKYTSTISEIERCQICNLKYKIQYNTSYSFSYQHFLLNISEKKTKCTLYSIFFVCTLIFYLSIGVYASISILQSNIKMIIQTFCGCFLIILVIMLGFWMREFLIKKDKIIRKIISENMVFKKKKSKNEKRIIAPLNLNIIQL